MLCCSEEIGKTKFNSMIGLVDRERVDEALYDDHETAKAREVCYASNVNSFRSSFFVKCVSGFFLVFENFMKFVMLSFFFFLVACRDD